MLNRYAVIEEKNKREIVLLRGRGCSWLKCRFCDYHTDKSPDEEQNYLLNKKEIDKVTGLYNSLEVINSGSFVDLDNKTMKAIEETCIAKNIKNLHFECHWKHKEDVLPIKKHFMAKGISLKVKTGIETFDYLYRESFLSKGIDTDDPAEIAVYFDECCLLFGLPGQTISSMFFDICTGLKYFERVCINIMQENTKPVKPDPKVIRDFIENIYPVYKDDERMDILMENTDFGIGGINI